MKHVMSTRQTHVVSAFFFSADVVNLFFCLYLWVFDKNAEVQTL